MTSCSRASADIESARDRTSVAAIALRFTTEARRTRRLEIAAKPQSLLGDLASWCFKGSPPRHQRRQEGILAASPQMNLRVLRASVVNLLTPYSARAKRGITFSLKRRTECAACS